MRRFLHPRAAVVRIVCGLAMTAGLMLAVVFPSSGPVKPPPLGPPCPDDVAILPACLADLAERAAYMGQPFTSQNAPNPVSLAQAGKMQAARDVIKLTRDQLPRGYNETRVEEIEVVRAAQARPGEAASLDPLASPFSGQRIAEELIKAGQEHRPGPETATFRAVIARWQHEIPLFIAESRQRTELTQLGTVLAKTGDQDGARRALIAFEQVPGSDALVKDLDDRNSARTLLAKQNLADLVDAWLVAGSPDQALEVARRFPLDRKAPTLAAIARYFLDHGEAARARSAVSEAYASADANDYARENDPQGFLRQGGLEVQLAGYSALVPLQVRLGDVEDARSRTERMLSMHVFMVFKTEIWAAAALNLLGEHERAAALLRKQLPKTQTFAEDGFVGPQRQQAVLRLAVALYKSQAQEEALAALEAVGDEFRFEGAESVIGFGLDCGHADAAVIELARRLRLPSGVQLRLDAAARCAEQGEVAAAAKLLEQALDEAAQSLSRDAVVGLSRVPKVAHDIRRPDLAATALQLEANRLLQDDNAASRARGLATVAGQAAEFLR